MAFEDAHRRGPLVAGPGTIHRDEPRPMPNLAQAACELCERAKMLADISRAVSAKLIGSQMLTLSHADLVASAMTPSTRPQNTEPSIVDLMVMAIDDLSAAMVTLEGLQKQVNRG